MSGLGATGGQFCGDGDPLFTSGVLDGGEISWLASMPAQRL